MSNTLHKNDLTFNFDGKGYACEQLAKLPEKFEEAYGLRKQEVQEDIQSVIDCLKEKCEKRFETNEAREEHSREERERLGAQLFDEVYGNFRKQIEDKPIFVQFMTLLSDWSYYLPEMKQKVIIFREMSSNAMERGAELVEKYILPILPEAVKDVLQQYACVNIAISYGHFALLFDDDSETRLIVTDKYLMRLPGVYGYVYLDVTPDGMPIARSRTDYGGGRAFFDGIHLMSHENFMTCAPKTIMIDGGYKVNSTRCTIVSGQLFDLIDVDNAVAHTTGWNPLGWFPDPPTFNTKDSLKGYEIDEKSGARMQVRCNGDVYLDDKKLKALGKFTPSKIALCDDGFAEYSWSEFKENLDSKYSDIHIVDDKQSWVNQIGEALKDDEGVTIQSLITKDKTVALKYILENTPEVLLLDMHLTENEQFDGLWIANQLAQKGYEGEVYLTSSYPEEHLRAMQKLIKLPIHIPGKNVEKVRQHLAQKISTKQ